MRVRMYVCTHACTNHDGDGLWHRLCALQRRPYQAAIVHDCAALPLRELRNAAEGGLANGQLELVHVPHDVKCRLDLFDFAQEHARVPVKDLFLRACADVAPARHAVKRAVQRRRVRRVGVNCAAVHRRPGRHDQIRASVCPPVHRRCEQARHAGEALAFRHQSLGARRRGRCTFGEFVRASRFKERRHVGGHTDEHGSDARRAARAAGAACDSSDSGASGAGTHGIINPRRTLYAMDWD